MSEREKTWEEKAPDKVVVEAEPDYSMTEEEQMADVAKQIIDIVTTPIEERKAEEARKAELEVTIVKGPLTPGTKEYEAKEARKVEYNREGRKRNGGS